MRKIKTTEEYRVNTEEEAKQAMEEFRKNAFTEGYILNSCGYTHKEKKSKGDVVDECFIVKVVKIYGGIWE